MTNLQRYEKVISIIPDLKMKGAANKYTSLNGNMFSFLDKNTGELAIRLGKEEREAFLRKFDTNLSVQYNTIMKEYPIVPQSVMESTRSLNRYFRMSYTYAQSLKPKPTKKK